MANKRSSLTKRLSSFLPWPRSKSKIGEDRVKVRGKSITVLESLGFTLTNEQLGEGANSVVFSGHSQRAGSQVAIKIYNKEKMLKDGQKFYFDKFVMRELKIVAMVSHPNIVRCIAAAASPNRVYIVMECLSGKTVRDQVAKHFRLPEPIVGVWINQLGNAISYLHSKGIAHRDIKCSNLLLDAGDNLKLSDFGVSTYQLNDPNALGIIWSGTFVGNLEYAAPEILLEREYIATKSDMWSIGVVAFVCLYGHFPFNGSTPRQVYQDIKIGLKKNVPSRIQISQDCRDIYMKLMDRDMNTRMGSKELIEHPFFLKYEGVKIQDARKLTNNMDKIAPSITPPMRDFKIVEDDNNRLNKSLTVSAVDVDDSAVDDTTVKETESIPDISEIVVSKRESEHDIINVEPAGGERFLESSVDKKSSSFSDKTLNGCTSCLQDEDVKYKIENFELNKDESEKTDIDQTISSSTSENIKTYSSPFNSSTQGNGMINNTFSSLTDSILLSTPSVSEKKPEENKSETKVIPAVDSSSSYSNTETESESETSSSEDSFARLVEVYNKAFSETTSSKWSSGDDSVDSVLEEMKRAEFMQQGLNTIPTITITDENGNTTQPEEFSLNLESKKNVEESIIENVTTGASEIEEKDNCIYKNVGDVSIDEDDLDEEKLRKNSTVVNDLNNIDKENFDCNCELPKVETVVDGVETNEIKPCDKEYLKYVEAFNDNKEELKDNEKIEENKKDLNLNCTPIHLKDVINSGTIGDGHKKPEIIENIPSSETEINCCHSPSIKAENRENECGDTKTIICENGDVKKEINLKVNNSDIIECGDKIDNLTNNVETQQIMKTTDEVLEKFTNFEQNSENDIICDGISSSVEDVLKIDDIILEINDDNLSKDFKNYDIFEPEEYPEVVDLILENRKENSNDDFAEIETLSDNDKQDASLNLLEDERPVVSTTSNISSTFRDHMDNVSVATTINGSDVIEEESTVQNSYNECDDLKSKGSERMFSEDELHSEREFYEKQRKLIHIELLERQRKIEADLKAEMENNVDTSEKSKSEMTPVFGRL